MFISRLRRLFLFPLGADSWLLLTGILHCCERNQAIFTPSADLVASVCLSLMRSANTAVQRSAKPLSLREKGGSEQWFWGAEVRVPPGITSYLIA